MDAAASFQGCSDRVESGIQNIAAMLQTSSGRRSLEQTFNLCQPLASGTTGFLIFSELIHSDYPNFGLCKQANFFRSYLPCHPLTVVFCLDGKDDYRFKHMITTLVGSAPQVPL